MAFSGALASRVLLALGQQVGGFGADNLREHLLPAFQFIDAPFEAVVNDAEQLGIGGLHGGAAGRGKLMDGAAIGEGMLLGGKLRELAEGAPLKVNHQQHDAQAGETKGAPARNRVDCCVLRARIDIAGALFGDGILQGTAGGRRWRRSCLLARVPQAAFWASMAACWVPWMANWDSWICSWMRQVIVRDLFAGDAGAWLHSLVPAWRTVAPRGKRRQWR